MMQKRIEIDKAMVIQDVVFDTQYCSKSRLDAENFEMIAITSADRSVVDRFWEESVGNLCRALGMNMESRCEDNTGLVITISVCADAKEDLEKELAVVMHRYLVANIEALWYERILPTEGERLRISMREYLEGVQQLLSFRKRPLRPGGILGELGIRN